MGDFTSTSNDSQSNPYKIVKAILMYIGVLIYFCCMYVYIGEVLYCPYYKRPALRHYQRRFYSLPFVRHKDTYSVLLTHDNLCKPTQVKQVVVAAIVILTTMWCG